MKTGLHPADRVRMHNCIRGSVSLFFRPRSAPTGVTKSKREKLFGFSLPPLQSELYLVRYRDELLVQFEVNLDVDLHGDGAAIFLSRLELPAANGFDSFLIEAHAQCA